MPRVLTLDGALFIGSVGLVDGDALLSMRTGAAADLAALADAVLREAGAFDAVAVTVGPGSFTGLRAALALAHGLALGRGAGVAGVTVGAALAWAAPPGRALWTAIDSKRGRVFLERDGAVTSHPLDALPAPERPVAIAGDAAVPVAARLAAAGANVMLLEARRPHPLGIAAAARRGPKLPPVPLYVDPPEARPGPAARPPPA